MRPLLFVSFLVKNRQNSRNEQRQQQQHQNTVIVCKVHYIYIAVPPNTLEQIMKRVQRRKIFASFFLIFSFLT